MMMLQSRQYSVQPDNTESGLMPRRNHWQIYKSPWKCWYFNIFTIQSKLENDKSLIIMSLKEIYEVGLMRTVL